MCKSKCYYQFMKVKFFFTCFQTCLIKKNLEDDIVHIQNIPTSFPVIDLL